MTRFDAPPEIRALADARAAARRARDWATADTLKARVEAAGWRIVDSGTMYDLQLAVPPDLVADGVTRYGASSSVPSRLASAPVGTASLIIVLEDEPRAMIGQLLAGLAAHAPDGTQVVLVANGTGEDLEPELRHVDEVDPGAPGVAIEVVRLAQRLGHAAALNAGIRRAIAPVVAWMDPAVELTGDAITPLAAALHDAGVAVAGPAGLMSGDPSRFEPAPATARDVVAIDGRLLAFRRTDYEARGPLDEGFVHPSSLDAWWSLVLRDGVDAEDAPPLRALQVAGLPVDLPARTLDPAAEAAEERRLKRNRYRLLKRFATRHDLLA